MQSKLNNKTVLYAFPVDINGVGGKNRATAQKIAALRSVCKKVYLPGFEKGSPTLFSLVKFELSSIILIMSFRRSIDIYISRGGVPLLSILIARVLGIYVIREVHADYVNEVRFLKKGSLIKLSMYFYAVLCLGFDNIANRRVYNNVRLLKGRRLDDSDRVVYNGGEPPKLIGNKAELRKKYKLSEGRCLVFSGSASRWHGIEYLVQLQDEFNRNNDQVQIVCAGAQIEKGVDPRGVLKNIYPLDSDSCCELILASDACLLPVKDIRTSPGSPLKLYDYLGAGRTVIAQADMPGYSDEVEKYACGITVDFKQPSVARDEILGYLSDLQKVHKFERNAFLSQKSWVWPERLASWL